MEVEAVAPHSFDLPHTLNLEFDPPSAASDAPPSSRELDLPAPAELEPSAVADRPEHNVPETIAAGEPPSLAGPGLAPADAPISEGSEYKAATKLQKIYRGYRTRRRLADTAVVAEELWWHAIDFARLNHSTVSFFNYSKPETATSRWNRVSLNASKVGRGLSKDVKALKLAFQHWIEAIDPRHRYGHNLHFYYEEWCKSKAGLPFFYWLDIGDGRDVDLEECPRSLLRKQFITYLGPKERENYEYIPIQGEIVNKQTGELLDTTKGPEGAKWIFVMSTSRKLYAGQKKKGMFHHSSFLAGGATLAAGRFTAENGVLKAISAYSGHYRPSEENLDNFLNFLIENGVNINKVQVLASSNEDYYDDEKKAQEEKATEFVAVSKPPQLEMPAKMARGLITEPTAASQVDEAAASQVDERVKADEAKGSYKRTLSGGLQSPRADVPQKAILERIKSKREGRSYQLGHQLSLKWCTGAGPRIGCVADYPLVLRVQAREIVNLSPRVSTPSNSRQFAFCASPSSPACSPRPSDLCLAGNDPDAKNFNCPSLTSPIFPYPSDLSRAHSLT